MKTFYHVAANALIMSLSNMFVWFGAIFFVYLETKSVLASSIIAGTYMVAATLSSLWFGAIVDHTKKKHAMLISCGLTILFLIASLITLAVAPEGAFTSASNGYLWTFILTLLAAVLCGNIRNIALPITATILVDADRRDRANGLSGMIMGFSSSGAGIGSGFALAYIGMSGIVLVGLALAIVALIHLIFLSIPEKDIIHLESKPKKLDIKGTISTIKLIPGLFALIFFTTFNNFLGGVFMALMDPYGLSLVPVQIWGSLWGFLSLGFILGGIYIAKKGLGPSPLRTLFTVNIIMWTATIIFPLQPSIYLLAAGLLVWTILMPFAEATEHTIIQKVVPLERQGRVIGFAQSIETAASPITSYLIGPLTQFVLIPFMTTGAGVSLIGDWFGIGPGRGMALAFIIAAFIGLTVTILGLHSRSYKLLSKQYVGA